VERAASAALQKRFDNTTVRVAVSLLERVGLIVRHFDAPRTAMLALTPEGQQANDAQFTAFRGIAYLPQGQTERRNVATLAAQSNLAPDVMEQMILDWQDQGWLRYRGDRRDPVIERLRPPQDVAGAINNMLLQQDQAQQRQISQMMAYATEERCRHAMLAEHLGEKIADCKTNCDDCAPPADRPTIQAKQAPDLPGNAGQVILECLLSFPFNVGKPSIIKALTGSAASNVRAERVKHFGALEGAITASIDRAIDEMVEAGYLDFYDMDGFKLVRPTEKAEDGIPPNLVTLKQKRPPKPAKAEREERPSPAWSGRGQERSFSRIGLQEPEEERPPTPEESDLFERLRAWRRVVANKANLPPYVIFHDKTLQAIARARPQSEEEFLAVKGVGQINYQRYGSELLELIAEN
jgi:superfamily II DNA helicase RecQ